MEIRETVVKYEMKARLEKEYWIVFSFFASIPLDIKNMGFLGKRKKKKKEKGICFLKVYCIISIFWKET